MDFHEVLEIANHNQDDLSLLQKFYVGYHLVSKSMMPFCLWLLIFIIYHDLAKVVIYEETWLWGAYFQEDKKEKGEC